MKSFKVMAAHLIAVDSVKKLLFCFSALTLLFVVASCSNESDLDGFSQESKVLSLANAKKLKNTVDSFNKTCYSYIYTGKSRAVSCGASDSIIPTLGTTCGVAVTVGLWGLCVGGIG